MNYEALVYSSLRNIGRGVLKPQNDLLGQNSVFSAVWQQNAPHSSNTTRIDLDLWYNALQSILKSCQYYLDLVVYRQGIFNMYFTCKIWRVIYQTI
jgi:hypothetical protein